jgi:hypothetical protein
VLYLGHPENSRGLEMESTTVEVKFEIIGVEYIAVLEIQPSFVDHDGKNVIAKILHRGTYVDGCIVATSNGTTNFPIAIRK